MLISMPTHTYSTKVHGLFNLPEIQNTACSFTLTVSTDTYELLYLPLLISPPTHWTLFRLENLQHRKFCPCWKFWRSTYIQYKSSWLYLLTCKSTIQTAPLLNSKCRHPWTFVPDATARNCHGWYFWQRLNVLWYPFITQNLPMLIFPPTARTPFHAWKPCT